MIDRGRKNILGAWVDAVDYDAAVAKVLAAAQERQGFAVAALAVHGLMTSVLDPTQRHRLNHFDLVVPDGQPVRWSLNWLYGAQLTDRVYGPTLMLKICERAGQGGLPIYLYGSRPPVIEALAHALLTRFPGLTIAGAQPSRFRQISAEEKRAIAGEIRDSGAAITFVGLGCPRQEVWAYENRDALSMPIVAVGAAFDFHAGTSPQAPPWLQKAGLEWLYRFAHEPARLWRRYLFLNPLFLTLLALQASGLVRLDPTKTVAPEQELRYG
jgi:exopolysaccharide biosynthesis WecB/TagA/CpsF family protein